MRRTYYRIDLETKSPLSIGAADSAATDCDVALDGQGKPFIPATSLRGVLRSHFASDKATRRALFGCLENGKTSEGALRVYDGTHVTGSNEAVSTRDNVKLEENDKVAKPGFKFDRQIVEQGARFRAYVEAIDAADCESGLEEALSALHAGDLRLGAKTTRGMGRMEIAQMLKRTFAFETGDIDSAAEWLEFDMFEEDSWRGINPEPIPERKSEGVVIDLELELQGAISIREYSTDVNQADFVQLFVREKIEEAGEKADDGEPGIGDAQASRQDAAAERDSPKAVVPGTSWAGAFRHRYRQFAGKETTEHLFGFVDEATGETSKSAIAFSESVIDGGSWKRLTRNAIDRFTGGTQDRALFTLKNCYGGTTHLEIRVEPGHDDELAHLLATILDLHHGFLAVGGLSSVGSGRFKVLRQNTRLKVNGVEIDGFYETLFGAKPDERGAVTVNLEEFAGKATAGKPEHQEVPDGR